MRRILPALLAGIVVGVLGTILIGHRRSNLAVVEGPTRRLSAVERDLERLIPRVDLDAVPFDEAVDHVRALTGVEISVDPEALKEAHFDRNTPITFHGRNVPLWQVLSRVANHDLKDTAVRYGLADDHVAISTPERLSRHWVARVYDARNLLRHDPDGLTENEQMQQIADAIEDNIDPDSWLDHGGWGGLHALSGRFIVTNGWETEQAVRRLLAQLADPDEISISSSDESLQAISGSSDGASAVRVYDVHDLLPPFVRPEPTTGPVVIMSTVGAAGVAADTRADKLARVITETIDPDSWCDNGGSQGGINAWRECLVIRQTEANHRRIQALLDLLRKNGRPPSTAPIIRGEPPG